MVVHDRTQPAAVASAPFDADQARLAIRRAGTLIPPLFPLDQFVAVAPLSGFEDRPFEAACRDAAALFGARTHLPLAEYRRQFAEGRLPRARLRPALAARLGAAAEAEVAPGVTALDLALARLAAETAPPSHLAAAKRAVASASSEILARVAPAAPASPSRIDRLPPAGAAAADAFVAKWCAAFLGGEAAAMPMPGRQLGLWRAVKRLAAADPDLAAFAGPMAGAELAAMADDPVEAVVAAAAFLDADDPAWLISRLFARLPGYAGHLRWRTDYAGPDAPAASPADLADLAALWFAVERLAPALPASISPQADPLAGVAPRLAAAAAAAAVTAEALGRVPSGAVDATVLAGAMPDADLAMACLEAAEETFRAGLLPKLAASAARVPAPEDATRPAAQVVFCIDVRSEPFRRALESVGPYETFGYAGFFGIPMAIAGRDGRPRTRLLPVLLSPRHEVVSAPAAEAAEAAEEAVRGERRHEAAGGLFSRLKQGVATAFGTAEAVGPLAGAGLLARSIAPAATARFARRFAGADKAREAFRPAPAFTCDDGSTIGLTLDEQVACAEAFLALTGFPAAMARLVVLAGHGSSTVNNPYAAAYDCGACGGHRGEQSARLLAQIMNAPEVRARLAAAGRPIPDGTVFVGAEHDTTTDEVTLFDRALVPASHGDDLARLEANLAEAGRINRARRLARLGVERLADDEAAVRASDWSEVRPEWGLARNAAFVVGQRSLTASHDLDGRVFLHSYDWRMDPEGKALTVILTAPMVVAEWINTQYFFSTVDNERFGSGDKVTQNVLGGFAIVQGNGGDLKVGLPRQAVFDDDGRPWHEPLRLTSVVHAPAERVLAVIAANDVLKRLFGNGWVALRVIDPQTGRLLRLTSALDFEDEPAAA